MTKKKEVKEIKEEMVIDGETYVLKKETSSRERQKNMFMDAANVMALYFDNDVEGYGEEEKIHSDMLDMDLVKVGDETDLSTHIGSETYVLPNGTKVSKYYVDYAQAIFHTLYSFGKKKKQKNFFVYTMVDKKGNAQKDSPVALVRNHAIVIVAPRVTND
ncbi:hypothetical protein GOV10_05515 [Candidatus Woesearchaeota archaeon]|nr:hypothetical protein [Candidatus Woesearchaeota archaeon]